jgi:hypothetical protein
MWLPAYSSGCACRDQEKKDVVSDSYCQLFAAFYKHPELVAPQNSLRGGASFSELPGEKKNPKICSPRFIANTQEDAMKWYHYIACFFAGAFLANVVPHFVQGISGNSFPTPFANPPGKGLSSPTVNVLWALFNLVIGYVLYRTGRVSPANKWSLLVFFVGIVYISITLSAVFVGRVH